jgi:hypothetical protein
MPPSSMNDLFAFLTQLIVCPEVFEFYCRIKAYMASAGIRTWRLFWGAGRGNLLQVDRTGLRNKIR